MTIVNPTLINLKIIVLHNCYKYDKDLIFHHIIQHLKLPAHPHYIELDNYGFGNYNEILISEIFFFFLFFLSIFYNRKQFPEIIIKRGLDCCSLHFLFFSAFLFLSRIGKILSIASSLPPFKCRLPLAPATCACYSFLCFRVFFFFFQL